MSLFTDSDVATLAAMRQLDPEVAAVDKLLSGIPIEGPGGICSLAWQECRAKLEASLQLFSTYIGQPGIQAHNDAVNNTGWGYSSGARARIRLNQIVVNDVYYGSSMSQIQQWVNYSALKALFQAASHRVMGGANKDAADRYSRKTEFYVERQREFWRMILSSGIPSVYEFLDCPGAAHGYQAGTFDATALSFTAGGTSTADQVIQVAIMYVDVTNYRSPLERNNAESGPSAILAPTVPAGNVMTVSIAGLNPLSTANPPDWGVSQTIAPMLDANHWNLYCGSQNGPLYLQNASPIPIATTSYALPDVPVFSGFQMGFGQHMDVNIFFGKMVMRG